MMIHGQYLPKSVDFRDLQRDLQQGGRFLARFRALKSGSLFFTTLTWLWQVVFVYCYVNYL